MNSQCKRIYLFILTSNYQDKNLLKSQPCLFLLNPSFIQPLALNQAWVRESVWTGSIHWTGTPPHGFDTLTSHFTKWQSMIMLQLTHVALMPFCRNAVFWNSIVHLFISAFLWEWLSALGWCCFHSFVFSAQFIIWWHGVVQGSLQAKHCFSHTVFSYRKCEIFHWNLWYIFRCFCFIVMKWCEKQNEHWFLYC